MVGPQEARFQRAFHKRSFLGRHFNGTPYWGYLRTKTHVAYLWLKPCHVVELWNPSSLGELFGLSVSEDECTASEVDCTNRISWVRRGRD